MMKSYRLRIFLNLFHFTETQLVSNEMDLVLNFFTI